MISSNVAQWNCTDKILIRQGSLAEGNAKFGSPNTLTNVCGQMLDPQLCLVFRLGGKPVLLACFQVVSYLP